MTSDVKIRVLKQGDAEAYWNLRLEALEREPRSFIESPEEHRAIARELGAARLRRTNNSSFVMGAFFEGELVGMAGFFRERHLKTRHKGRIWGVYVRANCRGKGLGRRLLMSLLKRVRKLPGLEQVNLSVSSSLAVARKLYGSLGFETFGVEDKALKIGNTYLSEDYMVLRLKAPLKKP
jgi:ribosomal protein S18 acetylase RimI-like enzyme